MVRLMVMCPQRSSAPFPCALRSYRRSRRPTARRQGVPHEYARATRRRSRGAYSPDGRGRYDRSRAITDLLGSLTHTAARCPLRVGGSWPGSGTHRGIRATARAHITPANSSHGAIDVGLSKLCNLFGHVVFPQDSLMGSGVSLGHTVTARGPVVLEPCIALSLMEV